MMRVPAIAAAAVLLLPAGTPARPQASPGEQRFRGIYEELVDTNTSLSAGSCTLAAERMECRDFLYRLVSLYANEK